MKYIALVLLFYSLSCSKSDQAPVKQQGPPPTVSIQTTFAMVAGIARPQFIISFNIPDTAAVSRFLLYIKSAYPYSPSPEIIKPKTGTYSLIDYNNTYPPSGANKTYFSLFRMTDFTIIENATFDVN